MKTNSHFNLLILLLVMMLPVSCLDSVHKLYDEFRTTQNVDTLQNFKLKGLDEQYKALDGIVNDFSGIQTKLKAVSVQLEGQIWLFEKQAGDIQKELDKLHSDITRDSTQVENLLAKHLADTQEKIAACNAALEALAQMDLQIEQLCGELDGHIDEALAGYYDYLKATYVTLEAQQELQSQITSALALIRDIKRRVGEMEERIDGTLEDSLEAMQDRIETLVTNGLTNYYTIAELEAQRLLLQTQVSANKALLDQIKKDREDLASELAAGFSETESKIAKLSSDINALRSELTQGYKDAIAAAISGSQSRLTAYLQTVLKAAYDAAVAKAAAVSRSIDAAERRMNNLEASTKNALARLNGALDEIDATITALMNGIQSISDVPQTSTGFIPVSVNRSHTYASVTLDYVISPASAAGTLANVWKSAVKVKAVHAATKAAPKIIDLPVLGFESNATTGRVSVTVDAIGLGEDFFSGEVEALAALAVTNGVDQVTSTFAKHLTPYEDIVIGIEATYTTSGRNQTIDLLNPEALFHFGSLTGILSIEYGDGTTGLATSHTYTSSGTHEVFFVLSSYPSEISADAFAGCINLTSIQLPSSVKVIDDGAFNACTALGNISFPSGLMRIGNLAFMNCNSSAFNRVTLPESLEEVGTMAFFNCTQLGGSLTIPSNLYNIQSQAFYGCSRLTSVLYIEDGVHDIAEFAFATSYSATASRSIPFSSVYSYSTQPPSASVYAFGYNPNRTLYVPRGSRSAYQEAAGWNKFTNITESL